LKDVYEIFKRKISFTKRKKNFGIKIFNGIISPAIILKRGNLFYSTIWENNKIGITYLLSGNFFRKKNSCQKLFIKFNSIQEFSCPKTFLQGNRKEKPYDGRDKFFHSIKSFIN